MRPTIRVLVVATGTVLFIGVGRTPDHTANPRGESAHAATVVSAQQPSAADRARQAAEAAVPGATAREVERGDDDHPGSAWEVELTRPDGATVEVDLDAAFKALATDRDDDRGGDD